MYWRSSASSRPPRVSVTTTQISLVRLWRLICFFKFRFSKHQIWNSYRGGRCQKYHKFYFSFCVCYSKVSPFRSTHKNTTVPECITQGFLAEKFMTMTRTEINHFYIVAYLGDFKFFVSCSVPTGRKKKRGKLQTIKYSEPAAVWN